jgi:dihydrofolate reductase
MIVSLIAAVAENRIIGTGDELPWRLPADMKHFKDLTTGHTVILGRRTFETLRQPLPNRRNVVVTRDREYRRTGAEVVHSIEDALSNARADEEVFVAGGGEIYELALPYADRLYLTIVHAEFEGDTVFPHLNLEEWTLVEKIRHNADEKHATPFSFLTYERARKRPA